MESLCDPANSLLDIAKEHNLTLSALSRLIASPDFQEELALVRSAASEQTRLCATLELPSAVNCLTRLIKRLELDTTTFHFDYPDRWLDKPSTPLSYHESQRKCIALLARLTKPPTPARTRDRDCDSSTPSQMGTRAGAGQNEQPHVSVPAIPRAIEVAAREGTGDSDAVSRSAPIPPASDPPATIASNESHAPSPITLHASPSSTHQSPITDHPFAPFAPASSPSSSSSSSPSVPPVPSLCTPCTASASSSSRPFPLADQPRLPLPELFKRAVRKLHTLPPPTTRAQQRELAHATKIHNRMFPDEPLPIPIRRASVASIPP